MTELSDNMAVPAFFLASADMLQANGESFT